MCKKAYNIKQMLYSKTDVVDNWLQGLLNDEELELSYELACEETNEGEKEVKVAENPA